MTMMIRMVVVSILSSFDLHGDDRTAGNNDVAGVFCRLPREIRNRSTCRGCASMRANNQTVHGDTRRNPLARLCSRVRRLSCSCRSALDAAAVRALPALGLLVQCPLAGFPISPRRCLSPLRGDASILRKFRQPRHVRFGSEADVRTAKSHVRFTTESGHRSTILEGPLRATSGHQDGTSN
jgi:hypothetical protein